jgi:hypothetical protein
MRRIKHIAVASRVPMQEDARNGADAPCARIRASHAVLARAMATAAGLCIAAHSNAEA